MASWVAFHPHPDAKGAVMFRIIHFAAAIATACVISGAAAAPAAKPTDPQIAHIVYTADNLDIENAKQALDKSKNEQVRNFAQLAFGSSLLRHATVKSLVQ
jgi:predicted outer membrane protein